MAFIFCVRRPRSFLSWSIQWRNTTPTTSFRALTSHLRCGRTDRGLRLREERRRPAATNQRRRLPTSTAAIHSNNASLLRSFGLPRRQGPITVAMAVLRATTAILQLHLLGPLHRLVRLLLQHPSRPCFSRLLDSSSNRLQHLPTMMMTGSIQTHLRNRWLLHRQPSNSMQLRVSFKRLPQPLHPVSSVTSTPP